MEMQNLTGDFESWTVTQTALGRILGLSVGRVNQLIDEQVIERDPSSKKGAVLLIQSLKNYYESKNDKVDGKGKKINFWEERALHERAKRKMAELKLRQMKSEFYRAELVDSLLVEILTNFKNKLLGLPNKLSPQIEGKNVAQVNKILTDEIYENLNELAENLKGADFNEEIEAEIGNGDTAAAEFDNQSMGE